MKIDLKIKRDKENPTPTTVEYKAPDYPCLYISNVESDDDLEMDQDVVVRGRVISITKSERDGKKSISFEIEARELEPGKVSKQSDSSESEDEEEIVEKKMDEVIEKEKSKKKDKENGY